MKQLRDNIQGGARPRIQGFSRWNKSEDILDTIYGQLQERGLPWTECTADYMTLTLNEMKFGEVSLEFALRIKKERENKARLHLICGITREDGKLDYAAAGDYIAENEEHDRQFQELLESTFLEDVAARLRKTGKRTWDRLPKDTRYENLDAEQCRREIDSIFETLLLKCRPDSKVRNKDGR